MANHKSAKKRNRQIKAKTEINNVRKSKVKTAINKLHAAIESKDQENTKKAFSAAEKALRKGAAQGIFKKTTISRRVSRLAKICKKAFS